MSSREISVVQRGCLLVLSMRQGGVRLWGGFFFVDKKIKLLYHFSMDDKRDLIHDMVGCVRRIIDKHTFVDESPLHFSEEIVLSPREIRTVDLIGAMGGVNVSEVAAHFHFTKSAASQLAARLVKMGFVDKRTSAHSNKEVRLSLTAKGREVHRFYVELMQKNADELMRRLDAFTVQQISTAMVMLEVMENVVDERLKDLT